jgi:hypothetical protein
MRRAPLIYPILNGMAISRFLLLYLLFSCFYSAIQQAFLSLKG